MKNILMIALLAFGSISQAKVLDATPEQLAKFFAEGQMETGYYPHQEGDYKVTKVNSYKNGVRTHYEMDLTATLEGKKIRNKSQMNDFFKVMRKSVKTIQIKKICNKENLLKYLKKGVIFKTRIYFNNYSDNYFEDWPVDVTIDYSTCLENGYFQ